MDKLPDENLAPSDANELLNRSPPLEPGAVAVIGYVSGDGVHAVLSFQCPSGCHVDNYELDIDCAENIGKSILALVAKARDMDGHAQG